jgi:vanillate O-demethylase monooxygenase subunit
MWTRRAVSRMIAAESGGEDGTAGDAAARLSAVTSAENARPSDDSDTGQGAEVASGVARHRAQPAAGLMGRGL